ncbi:MAG: hypothetical protein MI725_16225 [Pirellulales bacterium]|nr:hypothetical protein [Pirellulales bacterium]
MSYRTSARTSYRTSARAKPEKNLSYQIASTQKNFSTYTRARPEEALASKVELAQEKSRSRTIYRIRLTPVGITLPTDDELNKIVRDLKARRSDLAYFYLPGMAIKKPAWAVATKLSGNPAPIRRFDKRLPAQFKK